MKKLIYKYLTYSQIQFYNKDKANHKVSISNREHELALINTRGQE